MRKSELFVFAVLLLVCICLQPIAAQVFYGSVVGTVTDQSGATIPGGTVTLTNKGTGQVLEATTGTGGNYTVANVTAGTYDLKVTAAGFRTTTKQNVDVTINTVTRIDVGLEVGQVTEQVTVEASAVALQTDKADVHTEISAKAVENLPLSNYRNYQSLLDLVPGSTPARFQNANTDTPARALTTQINGTARNNNNTKLDGATNVFIWLPHHTVYVAPAETIETVNVSTNNFDADQGMAGGAAITVTTKSGTNELHGSAFDYLENSYFGAKNYFFTDPKKPKSIRSIPGFTVGGPIKKNKIFFFGGYEGLFERVNRNAFYTLPTADQMAGDFSAPINAAQAANPDQKFGIYDPTTGEPDGTGRLPFAGNKIPSSRISSISQSIQALLPGVNQSDYANNYFVSAGQKMNRKNLDAKGNWDPNDKFRLFGRYGYLQADVTGQAGLGQLGGSCVCDGGAGTGDTTVNVATVGYTYTFSPTKLYDATYGFTRLGHTTYGNDFGKNWGTDVFGIPGTNGSDPRQSGLPSFQISGYSAMGNADTWIPAFRNDQSFTTSQNFSIIHGAHEIRMGFDGVRHHLNHWQPEIGDYGPRGGFSFNEGLTALNDPSFTTTQFNAYAGFLLGLDSQAGKAIQYEKMSTYELQLGWYVRDRWQVTPKLTATLGLRYELYPMMTRSGRGGIEGYDPNTNQVLLGGAGGNPKDLGIGVSHKMFAPRIGLAYRVNNTTVIRTGYGITYDPMPLSRPLRGFYPLTVSEDFTSANSYGSFGTLGQGIPDFGGPNESTGSVPLPPTAAMRFITDNYLHRGYIQSWNFVVEKELPGKIVTSIGYVGTATVNSLADWNGNAAAPGTGTAGQPFFQKFGRTADTLYWNGFVGANYHSLQVSINRQVASGLTLKGAYTYSHAINYSDDDGWTGLTWNYQPITGRNRATAGYDRRNNFEFSYVYAFPFGKGKKWMQSGVGSAVLGGWQMNGIFAAYSGNPLTVGADGTSLNAPGNSQTADIVGPITKLGSNSQYYDISAFAPITTARFGSSGRNTVTGPGVINNDLSLFRDFKITERFKLTFKAEAFNVSNTPHFGNPDTTVNDAAFMQISGTGGTLSDQRSVRFGLRLGF